MSGNTRVGFFACFCGPAVVLGESGEGQRAIAAIQPADFAERDSKARCASHAVKKRFCNAHSVTIQRVLVGPCPDLPKHPNDVKL